MMVRTRSSDGHPGAAVVDLQPGDVVRFRRQANEYEQDYFSAIVVSVESHKNGYHGSVVLTVFEAGEEGVLLKGVSLPDTDSWVLTHFFLEKLERPGAHNEAKED